MAEIPAIKFAQRHKPLHLHSTQTIGTINNTQPISIGVRESIVYSPDEKAPLRSFYVDISIIEDKKASALSSIPESDIPEILAALGGFSGVITAQQSFVLRHAFFNATPFIRFSLMDGYKGSLGFGVQIYNSDVNRDANLSASSFGNADPLLVNTIKMLRQAQDMISKVAKSS
ncbi:hypothetical protein [Azospirillum sp. B510]|uniref:hypothetical protein n=1 Tax=Azospirillum sp. (strain B510) TaxID=137722 RepID=UPI0011D03AB3|nr:hypothetical protein [Azospirillum sp. B510]